MGRARAALRLRPAGRAPAPDARRRGPAALSRQHSRRDNTVGVDGPYLDENRPYWVAAAYGNADVGLGRYVKLGAGARFDYFSTFGSSINPRAALITRALPGRHHQAARRQGLPRPQPYELYYGRRAGRQRDLKPEQVYSGELEHSHRFTPTVVGLASVYANYVTDLVISRDAGLGDDRQLANSSSPALATGAELELRREWRDGWMFAVATPCSAPST